MRRVACSPRVVAASLVPAAPGAAAARTCRATSSASWSTARSTRRGFALDAESAAMRRAGVQSERFEIAWDLVEPAAGAVRLRARPTARCSPRRARGIDVLGPGRALARWAARHPGQPFSPPRDPADYAAFRRRSSRRYGPDGLAVGASTRGRRARPVRAWQIWNEPNLAVYWPSSRSARLRAAAATPPTRRCKRADPGATRRHGRPGELLVARPRAALSRGRREAALRRRRRAPVQRPARPTA